MKNYFGSKIMDFVSGLVILGVAGLAMFEAIRAQASFLNFLLVFGAIFCGFALISSAVARK